MKSRWSSERLATEWVSPASPKTQSLAQERQCGCLFLYIIGCISRKGLHNNSWSVLRVLQHNIFVFQQFHAVVHTEGRNLFPKAALEQTARLGRSCFQPLGCQGACCACLIMGAFLRLLLHLLMLGNCSRVAGLSALCHCQKVIEALLERLPLLKKMAQTLLALHLKKLCLDLLKLCQTPEVWDGNFNRRADP